MLAKSIPVLHNRLQIRAKVFNPCPNFPACVHVNKDVNPVPDIIYPVFAGQAKNALRGVEGVGGFSSIASTSPGCMITIGSTSTSTTRTISTKSSLLSALGGLTGELFSILRLGKKFHLSSPEETQELYSKKSHPETQFHISQQKKAEGTL